MLDQPEVIRQQMEETRASLGEKIETLEQHVVQTVSGTTAAVSETVGSVKETVQETVEAVKGTLEEGVESVKNALDLARQMDRHPWLFMAGSVAVGYCGGRLLAGASEEVRAAESDHFASATPQSSQAASALAETPEGGPQRYASASEAPREAGLLASVASEFSTEIQKAKSLAIGTALGLIRDAILNAAPESLKHRVEEVANSVTVKLGGEVIAGPVCTFTQQGESEWRSESGTAYHRS